MTDDTKRSGNIDVCPLTGKLGLRGYDVGPKFRHRDPNNAKFKMEETTGKDWSESLGRFVTKHRRIDRENDRYFERVIDDKTGDVLHECDQPLSEHIDRGSAKKDDA